MGDALTAACSSFPLSWLFLAALNHRARFWDERSFGDAFRGGVAVNAANHSIRPR